MSWDFLRLNDTVKIIVGARWQQAKPGFVCLGAGNGSLLTGAQLFSIMCSGKGRKSILANITSGTPGIKGIFYSVMSSSVSSLKPSASDDETVPRPNNTNNN